MPVTNETAEIFRNFTRLGDRPIAVVEHSWYGRMWAPTDLEEFSRVIDHLAWQSPGGWRGQANLEWKLDSGAARRLRLVERDVSEPEAVVADYERTLLHRARLNGWGVHARRELGDLELLARLQHHGAATRLLDFTRSVYVALWFAASQQPELWGLLIGLDLMDVWTIDDPGDCPTADGRRRARWGRDTWCLASVGVVPPAARASRIFPLGPNGRASLGSIGRNPHKKPAAQPISRTLPTFVCVAVSPALKASIELQAASLFGFSAETLFPDFDGFARAQGVQRPAVVLACGQQRLPARHAAIE